MDFYYPNPTNDFWRIMGLIFTGDPDAYYIRASRSYRLDAIKELLDREGIAMADTGMKIQRLRGNASDAYLHIVEPIDLQGIIAKMPGCHTIVTTGEKAAMTVASLTGTTVPAVGSFINNVTVDGRSLRHFRMPSSSRAYPLPLASKAQAYRRVFDIQDNQESGLSR